MIVFAYDDIAINKSNPFIGKVFNAPSPTSPGIDVYKGVVIDYRKENVDPKLFLEVLKGNKEAVKGKGTGRVLESTKDDNVFIFFSDHGAPGLIAFPSDDLYANDLISTLQYMFDNQKYNKLVFYLEACESGSMFKNILPTNINVYATTASNELESSWATYCGSNAVVNRIRLSTCLGDLYSVNWLEDADLRNSEETIGDQFEIVKKKTDQSPVNEFGDLSIKSLFLKEFFGEASPSKLNQRVFNKQNRNIQRKSIDSRLAKFHHLSLLYKETKSILDLNNVIKELSEIRQNDLFFKEIKNIFELKEENQLEEINFTCYENVLKTFKSKCSFSNEYSLKFYRHFVNACFKNETSIIEMTIDHFCDNKLKN